MRREATRGWPGGRGESDHTCCLLQDCESAVVVSSVFVCVVSLLYFSCDRVCIRVRPFCCGQLCFAEVIVAACSILALVAARVHCPV